MKQFDVVIIGGGPGGTPAAIHLAQSGKEVLLVDDRGKPGGECLFEGCIPSKILEQSADGYHLLKEIHELGIRLNGTPSINWRKVIEKKNRILKLRSEAAQHRLEQMPGLTFAAAKASFASNNVLDVSYTNGEKETVGFDKALIATGSRSFIPPIKGSGIKHVWTSREIFDEEELPGSIVILGAGPIGIEFAQMLAKLGVSCKVVEMKERILPPVDAEFAQLLMDKMVRQDGIEVYLSAKVVEIDHDGKQFDTVIEDKAGGTQTVRSDKVLVATGRTPNIEGLNLDAANIKHDRAGVQTDEHLETTAKGIYAVGDVTAAPKFAHTATYGAHIAAENMIRGNKLKTDFSKNAWVLFSDPEIASAGLTEEEAVKAGHNVITGEYDFRADARAQINEHPFGYLKFVVEKETLRILGVHIFTEGASGISGEASLIVSMKATLKDVAGAIHSHPTLTESFGLLAGNMLSSLAR